MKNYLIFGFPLSENEKLREGLISLYKQHPDQLFYNERNIINTYLYEHPENPEAFFGIALANWEVRECNIDVKYDTLRYWERLIVQEVQNALNIDLSLNKFRILGFSKQN